MSSIFSKVNCTDKLLCPRGACHWSGNSPRLWFLPWRLNSAQPTKIIASGLWEGNSKREERWTAAEMHFLPGAGRDLCWVEHCTLWACIFAVCGCQYVHECIVYVYFCVCASVYVCVCVHVRVCVLIFMFFPMFIFSHVYISEPVYPVYNEGTVLSSFGSTLLTPSGKAQCCACQRPVTHSLGYIGKGHSQWPLSHLELHVNLHICFIWFTVNISNITLGFSLSLKYSTAHLRCFHAGWQYSFMMWTDFTIIGPDRYNIPEYYL